MTDYRDRDIHRTFMFNADQLRERTVQDVFMGAVLGFAVAVVLHILGVL